MRAVHREAQYYAISPLLDSLEDIQPLTGEKVRQAFLDLLPYYRGTRTPSRRLRSSPGSSLSSNFKLKARDEAPDGVFFREPGAYR